jgi:hypothetical protein
MPQQCGSSYVRAYSTALECYRERSSSREANGCSVSKETSHLLCNIKHITVVTKHHDWYIFLTRLIQPSRWNRHVLGSCPDHDHPHRWSWKYVTSVWHTAKSLMTASDSKAEKNKDLPPFVNVKRRSPNMFHEVQPFFWPFERSQQYIFLRRSTLY